MKIIKMLSWGILAALGALIVELSFSVLSPSVPSSNIQTGITWALLGVVLVEEFFKFILIRKAAEKKGRIFLDAFFIGTGFALVEIILNSFSVSNFWLAYVPQYLGLFLVHTATALIYGYIFAIFGRLNFAKTLAVFSAGFILHFLYNACIIYNLNYLILNSFLLIFIVLLFCLYFRRKQSSLPNSAV